MGRPTPDQFEVTPNCDGNFTEKTTEDVTDLANALHTATLDETKKPKRVRKRKKKPEEKRENVDELHQIGVKTSEVGKEKLSEEAKDKAQGKKLNGREKRRQAVESPQDQGDSPRQQRPFYPDNQKSATKKKPQSKKQAEKDQGFEDYLTAAEVEQGLKNKSMVAGAIRINQRCYKEAYISSEGDEKDIMIDGLNNRNRALEGDEVVVLLNPPEDWKASGQRTGKVVYIEEEVHSRSCIGRLPSSLEPNGSYVVFSPRDSRVPRIKIQLGDPSLPPGYLRAPAFFAEVLFKATITSWTEVGFAQGTIVEEVGRSGDLEVETLAILLENNLDPKPMNPSLSVFFPRMPYTIPAEEIARRQDLRRECIFTIDPATARDLDDAVSAKVLENGNVEVGVHISDVAHFMQPNTLLDHTVSRRATTIYLVQRVYHMLPVELCLLCSLTHGEDKLAFSVFIELTPDAQVVSHRFARSVIHSCAKLAYEHAQMVIDNPEKTFTAEDFPEVVNGFTAEDCATTIRKLYQLSVVMRKQRFDTGALRIDQPKLCFHLDPQTQTPLSSFIYENKESHRLIEEFMLLANMTVAKHIYDTYPKLAFMRRHESPQVNMMVELQKRLEQYGIHLDASDAGSLHSSMVKYSSPIEGEDLANSWARYAVLNNLCAKPLLRAKYFCASEENTDTHHYALNVPYYTHFTSPIRRYADVMVHRLLASSLDLAPQPTWTPADTRKIAIICNQKKLAAKVAGEQSGQLFLALYLQQPVECMAAVLDVKDRSFDVIVREFGIMLRVYTDPLRGQAVVTHSNEDSISQLNIRWRLNNSMQLIQLFSVVHVQVTRASDSLKLAATLLPPQSA